MTVDTAAMRREAEIWHKDGDDCYVALVVYLRSAADDLDRTRAALDEKRRQLDELLFSSHSQVKLIEDNDQLRSRLDSAEASLIACRDVEMFQSSSCALKVLELVENYFAGTTERRGI